MGILAPALTGAARIVNLGANATTNTTRLQAALDAGGHIYVRNSGEIDDTLTIGSDTHLELAPDATITLATNSNCNMLTNSDHVNGNDNIVVSGGGWDRQANGGTGTGLHTLMFRNVDNITVRGLRVDTSGGKYAVNLGNVTNYTVENLYLESASDGVHINGPASQGVIRDIVGLCGDDLVSLTASDFAAYNDTEGNITDTLIERIHALDGQAAPALKLTANKGTTYIERVTARHVRNESTTGAYAFSDDTGDLDLRHILLEDIEGAGYMQNGDVTDLTVRGWAFTPDVNSRVGLAITGTTIQSITLDGVTCDGDDTGFTANHLVNISSTASIGTLRLTNATHRSINAYTVRFADATSTADRVELVNVLRDGVTNGGGLIGNPFGSAITELALQNCATQNTSWLLDTAGSEDVYLTNVRGHGLNVRAGASVTIRGAGIGALASSSNAGTLRSKSLDFTVDASLLALNDGDMAYNTNDALSCGAGPVACNGTTWTNLATGDTYTP